MTDRSTDQLPRAPLDEILIRELTKKDLPALEWDGEYTHFRNVYRGVYQRTRLGTAAAWVAESPVDGIVGQVFLQLDCDRPELANGWNRAYLYSFRIKPPYRGLGLGTRMVKTLESYLVARHYSRLTLNVARDNLEAIRLYHRLNFQIVGEEPGIWSYIDHLGKWHTVEEPSWRMEKHLL